MEVGDTVIYCGYEVKIVSIVVVEETGSLLYEVTWFDRTIYVEENSLSPT